MNKFLWSGVTLLALFVTVESLSCYTCDVSILGYCFRSASVNCTAPQNSCFTSVADFSADLLPIHAKGCIEESACKNETNMSILTVKYNITTHCCSTNLCNGATSVQLPLTAAVGAALLALLTQWSL
uniref:lymphocyte antigen-6, epidermis isoform X2 n=1 Tax=Scatophagus argus TaxID=75038 RepID=UPI001ED82EE7|nr:lymphocyte antigen-6, epidermis isoform X2 [Scatophagus argus]